MTESTSEVIYSYAPGKGWIPRGRFVFNPELYKGAWFEGRRGYYYPEHCRGYSIINVPAGEDPENGLKPGDFIPFNERHGYLVLSVDPTKYVYLTPNGDDEYREEPLPGYWEDVARL